MTQNTKQYKDAQGQQKTTSRTVDPDDLQFEVSEAHNVSGEFVGGKKGFSGSAGDELGVESPSEMLQKQSGSTSREAVSEEDKIELAHDFGGEIDGFTSNTDEAHTNRPYPAPKPDASQSADSPRPTETARIRQLSEKELKQIEQNLYGSSAKLSDREKGALLSKLSAASALVKTAHAKTGQTVPAAQSPAVPVTPSETADASQPVAARRARGIAYFYKNWVEIITSHPLHVDDEIIMGDRAYILRPKKLSSTTKITLYGVLAGLAICFIAIAMVGGNSPGEGSIVGMVLNTDGLPYVQGAVIQISESGIRTESNGIGMFRLDDVPKGSHKLDIVVDGKVVGTDFATASDNDLTMTVVKMTPPITAQESNSTSSANNNSPTATETPAVEKTQRASNTISPDNKPVEEAVNRNAVSPALAKIVLEANVSDARFILDGKTIGAGNNTYSSIKSGDHKYQVSRDGFKPASGTIHLSSGESKTLSIQLEPDRVAGKPATSETQYFESGGIKMQTGDYTGAIADYTKAVEAKPSYADAFVMRAEAYRSLSDPRAAHDDFIRAAEIYRFRRDPTSAQTSYAKAIEVDGRSVTAHLGRADLFLSQGQEIAALADFEQVLRADKRNFEAHFGLGRCRFNQGNYKQAERHFKDARELDRQKTATYEYLMLCYFQLDQLKDLKKAWDQYRSVADPAEVTRIKSDSRFAAAIRTAETQ